MRIVLALLLTAPVFAQDDALTAKLDDYLTRLSGFGFSGVALVAKDDHILLQKGFGMADRRKGIPTGADTVVSIGSITKQFTAAAILKLEMQGKLHTADTIARFFPNAPADKKSITIHQLLTHTSGLRSDFSDTDYEPVMRDEYIGRALHSALLVPPGKEFHYANSGYSVLAAIVELASGLPYERYLHDFLFEPAGMHQTGYKIPHWPIGRVARGYENGREWGTILEHPWAPDGPYWELRGNGGIHSTAGDMYRWHVALQSDTVLSSEAREKFQTGYVAEGPGGDSSYAYGWSVTQSPRGKLIEHNGGNGIFAADFLRYVDAGVVVFVASNSNEVPAPSMSHPLGRIALGLDYVLPPATIPLSEKQLGKFAGVYVLPSGGKVTVTADNGGLAATTQDQDAFGLLEGGSAGDAKKLNERVAQIIEHSAQGDYTAVSAAFPESRRAMVEARERNVWRQFAEAHGKFRRVVVLGSSDDGDNIVTLARLEFDRGVIFIRYLWNPDGALAGMMLLDRLPTQRYFAESEAQFVSFSLPGPLVRRLKFRLDGRNSPIALVFGDIGAKRAD
jgi:CubicO group peptidase (beta-lactamase class C family)